MRFNKIMGSLFVAALGLGIANAAVIDNITSTDGTKNINGKPTIADVDGKKAFVSTAKGYKLYSSKKKIEVDPAKKYQVSVKVKQINEKPSYIWVGFVPYTAKGRRIGNEHGNNNTKGSFTALTAAVAKGAKTITVKDASKWKSGKYYYVAFNAKEDMSDIPNFDLSSMISKVENNTITLTKTLKKAYPAGTMVRQHRSGGTYIYTKSGKAPKAWATWKGKPAQGAIFRKATFIRPMIMIRCNAKETGAAFDDFVVEEL
jgi:uncharacterized protein YqfB (UPF0267 family)